MKSGLLNFISTVRGFLDPASLVPWGAGSGAIDGGPSPELLARVRVHPASPLPAASPSPTLSLFSTMSNDTRRPFLFDRAFPFLVFSTASTDFPPELRLLLLASGAGGSSDASSLSDAFRLLFLLLLFSISKFLRAALKGLNFL